MSRQSPAWTSSGILVILRQEDGLFYKPNGSAANGQDLERHVSNILAKLGASNRREAAAIAAGGGSSQLTSSGNRQEMRNFYP